MLHDELAHSLAQHLQNDNRMVWEDIPAGCAGNVRPDVYTIDKSFTSPNPISYEVKVSMSDFRSDVTKAKWHAYKRFSYGVVFAVPKGLITKNDLPNGCGLITYNGAGIWRTVKKPTLQPCEIDSDILLKLLMSGYGRMSRPKLIQPRDFAKYKHMDKLRKKFGEDIGKKLQLIEEYPQKKRELKALKAELSQVLDIEEERWCFTRDIKYKIEQIRIMACETERKKKISEDLEGLKEMVNIQVDRVITKYTEETNDQ